MHSNQIRHRCLEVSQRNGKAVNRSAAGSQCSVIESEGQHPDRQISHSATLNPRRCHLLLFSWFLSEIKILSFLVLASILLDTKKTNSLAILEDSGTSLWKEQDLFLFFWFLQQWKDYGSGFGNVQYQFHPLVRHFRTTAWKITSKFLSLPCPYSTVFSTGTASMLSF